MKRACDKKAKAGEGLSQGFSKRKRKSFTNPLMLQKNTDIKVMVANRLNNKIVT
jgi:hypothetical protein